VASNGTVQAKTWNPNGLAAIANLLWGAVDKRPSYLHSWKNQQYFIRLNS